MFRSYPTQNHTFEKNASEILYGSATAGDDTLQAEMGGSKEHPQITERFKYF